MHLMAYYVLFRFYAFSLRWLHYSRFTFIHDISSLFGIVEFPLRDFHYRRRFRILFLI